eukprot:TRINITY_DN108606_c0_g1_i1.p1 TRINITY_DN108606_c0_g1~~TRINITY_DN108606_c0_g1_i1.p1  ORF type:complete len:317 (+),score=40.03 TRINITY_DN108606_c0_g1_i1:45-953(+)
MAGFWCYRSSLLCLVWATSVTELTRGEEAWRPRYVHPRRFSVQEELSASLEHLREQGFVVYRDVLTPVELKVATAHFWDFWEGIGVGISRHDPSSWQDPRLRDYVGHGIFAACGVGQSAVMWHLRGQPQVRAVFEAIWGTDDLLVSLDGLVVFPSNFSLSSIGHPWYHWDLNPLLWRGDGLPMVQGYLSLQQGEPQSGGLVLVPQSHAIYKQLAERYSSALRNVHDLTGHSDHFVDYMLYDESTRPTMDQYAVLLHVEAADLVIWDARTVHCNSKPRPRSSPSQPGLALAGALITMAPRSRA